MESATLGKSDPPWRMQWFGVGDEETGKVLEQMSRNHAWFEWRGAVSQEELWAEMAEADLFLNVSHEEGGANAVCEAVVMGLPVVASDVAGNVGLLGKAYEGLFREGEQEALGEVLRRCVLEEGFYGCLERSVKDRQGLFSRDREQRGWENVLRGGSCSTT